MNIKILYDVESVDPKYVTGWGFSCVINNKVIFDLGGDYKSLLKNATPLDLELSEIDTIVISHEHWDHMDGLQKILKNTFGASAVYACPGFSEEFKEKIEHDRSYLIEVDSKRKVLKNVFSTGEMTGKYRGDDIFEQSLVVTPPNSDLGIITGCAHPGIVNIVKKVKQDFPGSPIEFVIGGFHLKDLSEVQIDRIAKELKELGVKTVGPAHCSGKIAKNIFKEIYKENYIEIGAGKVLTY
jgi:7,8-dihydropterin-6-yl-methyl-4-(beta-D-ribofuranosyl)aminobenzene 5'-phosphate synthase